MTFPTSDLNGQAGFDDLDERMPPEEDITRESLWTTRAGNQIAIKNMTDSHLLNTIRVLREISPIGTRYKTSAERRQRWVNAMATETYARGLTLDELTEKEPAVHG